VTGTRKIQSQLVHAEAERLHELLAQNLARMHRLQSLGHRVLLMVVRDFDVVGVALAPSKTDPPLVVDPNAVLS
jgi:hypothetical protein